MKRKDYLKPTMKVVQLKQQQQLLAGSKGIQSMRSGYGKAQEYEWDESLYGKAQEYELDEE